MTATEAARAMSDDDLVAAINRVFEEACAANRFGFDGARAQRKMDEWAAYCAERRRRRAEGVDG